MKADQQDNSQSSSSTDYSVTAGVLRRREYMGQGRKVE
jgi:hypothetical protein